MADYKYELHVKAEERADQDKEVATEMIKLKSVSESLQEQTKNLFERAQTDREGFFTTLTS